MKKKLFSAALILAAMMSFNASAQEPATANAETTESVSAQDVKADKNDKMKRGDRKGPRHGDKKDFRHGGRGDCKGMRPDLFKGITLTADQQARLDALRPERPGRPEGSEAKPDRAKCDKADKGGCDKAARGREFRGEGRHGRHHGMRADYVRKVKEILTPEQYVVFLENIVLQPGDGAPCKSKDGRKDGNKGRTVCPEEGNCPVQAEK